MEIEGNDRPILPDELNNQRNRIISLPRLGLPEPPIVPRPTVSARPAFLSVPPDEPISQDEESHPIALVLLQIDAIRECKWMSGMLIVFYVSTILLWPTVLLGVIGLVTGCIGFWASSRPYSFMKASTLLLFASLNVFMTCVLPLYLSMIFKETSSLLGITCFSTIVGIVLHVRSAMWAFQVSRKSGMYDAFLESCCCRCKQRPSSQLEHSPVGGCDNIGDQTEHSWNYVVFQGVVVQREREENQVAAA